MTELSTTANTSRSETSTLEAVGVGQGRDDGLDDRVRAREEASKWLRGVATGVGKGQFRSQNRHSFIHAL